MESYLWLKNSNTYQSINGDDSEDITPHVKYLCQPVINGPADVAQILGAIQYWDVYEIPANIILYFATHLICSDDIPFIIEEEWLDLFTKLFYLYNISKCVSSITSINDDLILYKTICDNFKSCVRMDFYRVFVSSFSRYFTKKDELKMVELMKLACYVGNLDCFQFIHDVIKTGIPGPYMPYMEEACMWSIAGNNVNCLKYAREQHFYYNEKNSVDSDYFIKNSYKNIIIDAAICGHLEGLLYVFEQHPQPPVGPHWSSVKTNILRQSCICATRNGHLCCLKFLHTQGGLLTENTAIVAVENGHLECLRYLHKNNCPCGDVTCWVAVRNCQLDCLQYLYEHKCLEWSTDTCDNMAYFLNCGPLTQNIEWKCNYLRNNMAYFLNCVPLTQNIERNNYLDCMTYAIRHGCPYSENVFNAFGLCVNYDKSVTVRKRPIYLDVD